MINKCQVWEPRGGGRGSRTDPRRGNGSGNTHTHTQQHTQDFQYTSGSETETDRFSIIPCHTYTNTCAGRVGSQGSESQFRGTRKVPTFSTKIPDVVISGSVSLVLPRSGVKVLGVPVGGGLLVCRMHFYRAPCRCRGPHRLKERTGRVTGRGRAVTASP